jgi:hypothetical protein
MRSRRHAAEGRAAQKAGAALAERRARALDTEAPLSDDGRGARAQGRQTMLDAFVSLRSKSRFDAAIPICGRSGAFDKEYLCEEPYWGISSSSPRSRSWRPRATATTFQNTARFQSRAGVGWAA